MDPNSKSGAKLFGSVAGIIFKLLKMLHVKQALL